MSDPFGSSRPVDPPLRHRLSAARARAARPCGKGTPANTYTESVFPEGRVWRCQGCGGAWLVIDATRA